MSVDGLHQQIGIRVCGTFFGQTALNHAVVKGRNRKDHRNHCRSQPPESDRPMRALGDARRQGYAAGKLSIDPFTEAASKGRNAPLELVQFGGAPRAVRQMPSLLRGETFDDRNRKLFLG